MPTPPQPITTTELPGVIFAVLIAAPTPVVTPQPISDTTFRGMSSATLITAPCGRIISSANVPQPVIPETFLPSITKCGVIAIAIIVSQRFAWPRRHALHMRHAGTNETIA